MRLKELGEGVSANRLGVQNLRQKFQTVPVRVLCKYKTALFLKAYDYQYLDGHNLQYIFTSVAHSVVTSLNEVVKIRINSPPRTLINTGHCLVRGSTLVQKSWTFALVNYDNFWGSRQIILC